MKVLHISPQPKTANAECVQKGFCVRENLVKGLSPDGQVHVDSRFEEDPLPSPDSLQTDYHALIITGSSYGVHDQNSYLESLRCYTTAAIARRVPILGICFGHQLLAHQYGATVQAGVKGKEKGAVQMKLTPDGKNDALFQNVPQEFTVGTYHGDIVTALPTEEHASTLAENDNYSIQALAIGDTIRTVQFHPEFTAFTGNQISNGKVPVAEDVEGIERVGTQILRNFIKNFAQSGREVR